MGRSLKSETTGKSAAPAKPRKIPQPHGGALNSGGTPGNKGGGRPKDEWLQLLRELASTNRTMAGLKQILADPAHPHYLKALEFAADRGYGKPTQLVGGDPDQPLRILIEREAE